MKYAWIDTQRSAFPLPVLCDALSVSQSGFRAWQAGGTPERKRLTDGQALVLIRTIHQEVRQAYGARRIHAELSGRGYRIGRPDNKKANPCGLAFLLACLGSSTWARTRDRAPRKTSFPENPAYKNQRLTEPILQKSGVFRGARPTD